MNRASRILSTYRLQFRKEFPFSAGAKLAGYLRQLGISHVYSSPILAARAGSEHGYDVISYEQINPELGGTDGFRVMAQALRTEGLGIILDIVPNHVAVGGDDNAMWLDLLKKGRASRYANWFDIDFDESDPVLAGRIHAPFLGEPLQEALALGKIELVDDPMREGFALRYGEHLFPIRAEDESGIRGSDLRSYRDVEVLQSLLERQHYRLDFWRSASDRLNWRRFFEITQLAGMRMEVPQAFEAAHRLAFALYEEGLIDGLRIDHVDGLADPAAYCAALRARLDEVAGRRPAWATPGPAWLIVEKILAPGEALPSTWAVDGTTGYDFMDQASAILHPDDADNRLGGFWSEISGRPAGFADEEQLARREVLEHGFDGQLEAVIDRLMAIAALARPELDMPRGAMRRAAAALACQMRSYRTYLTGATVPEDPGPFFAEAMDTARGHPQAELTALDFIAEVMSGAACTAPSDLRSAAIRRFNQLTAPLAARSVEDTAFYRYGRLLSRNDVGFDASRFALSIDAFHRLMEQRAQCQPRSMLALATHDHKRGADVRARLATASHDPQAWQAAVTRWFELNDAIRPDGLDRGDEYQLYQMLLGTWPFTGVDGPYADRMGAWWLKALREAKLRTGWIVPNESYEQIAEGFLRAALDPGRSAAFHGALDQYLDFVGAAAAWNGLVQLVLQCTVPGVPDTYQGAEFWDFSTVDPDNRRPVDYAARASAIERAAEGGELPANWRDGRIKQEALRQLLNARRDHPCLFLDANYRALTVSGSQSERVIAFARESAGLILAVIAPIADPSAVANDFMLRAAWWGDTHVELPEVTGEWTQVVGWGAGDTSASSPAFGCRVLIGRR